MMMVVHVTDLETKTSVAAPTTTARSSDRAAMGCTRLLIVGGGGWAGLNAGFWAHGSIDSKQHTASVICGARDCGDGDA